MFRWWMSVIGLNEDMLMRELPGDAMLYGLLVEMDPEQDAPSTVWSETRQPL